MSRASMSLSRRVTLQRLATILAALAAWAAIGPMSAAEIEKKEGYGYDDTPFLPGSPWRVHDGKRPQPPMVDPGNAGATVQPSVPPADAIVLFDGKDLLQWDTDKTGGIEDGAINLAKTGELRTRRKFADCQLHVEWATPAEPDGDAMNWGNSGVLFLGKYELQIIESHDCRIYADGIAGSVYGQYPPLVNAARKPGQWQTFDVVFRAPKFDGDKLLKPACFTVLWNGLLVQDHQASLGPVKHRALATYDAKDTEGPIVLQYHHSAVRIRNVWVRTLAPQE
jgi:hypothetical protein